MLPDAWGAIGRLFRVLFVRIFLLIFFHLHCKYSLGINPGPQQLCGSGSNCRDLGDVQQHSVCVCVT